MQKDKDRLEEQRDPMDVLMHHLVLNVLHVDRSVMEVRMVLSVQAVMVIAKVSVPDAKVPALSNVVMDAVVVIPHAVPDAMVDVVEVAEHVIVAAGNVKIVSME